MRMFSHFSLGLALAAGSVLALTTAPVAVAKEKEAKPKYSKEFAAEGGAVQKALEGDPAVVKPMLDALLAKSWTGIDAYAAGSFAVNFGSKNKDDALTEKGVNMMLTSGFAQPAEAARLSFFAGNFAYGAGRFGEAQQKLQAAIDGGYTDNAAGALLAEAFWKENKFAEGFAALDRAIAMESAKGAKAPEQWFRRGTGMALKSNIPGATADWSYKLVAAYPSGDNWRAALTVYRDSVKLDTQENLDVMRLMRRADAMVSARDCAEYAEAADPRRLPGEVVSAIDHCRAKGIDGLNVPYITETYTTASGRVSADRASLSGSERDAEKAADGKIAIATGDALMSYSEYSRAAAMYQAALSKGGVDAARANMGLALAKFGLSDVEGAKMALAAVTGNRKRLADFWTLWIAQNSAAPAAAVTS